MSFTEPVAKEFKGGTVFFFLESYERFLIRGYGNKEHNRRLEVVKLLTAVSYCVGDSFICSSFQH